MALQVEQRTEEERRRLEAAEAAANRRGAEAEARAEAARREAVAAKEQTEMFAAEYQRKQAETEARLEALAGCRQQVETLANQLWNDALNGSPESRLTWMGAPPTNPYGATRFYDWRLADTLLACGG